MFSGGVLCSSPPSISATELTRPQLAEGFCNPASACKCVTTSVNKRYGLQPIRVPEAVTIGNCDNRQLCIAQVANLYGSGADKLPMDGRVQFAEQHLPDIFQTADDPLGPDSTWYSGSKAHW